MLNKNILKTAPPPPPVTDAELVQDIVGFLGTGQTPDEYVQPDSIAQEDALIEPSNTGGLITPTNWWIPAMFVGIILTIIILKRKN